MNNDQKLKDLFMQLFSYMFPEDLKDVSFFDEPINMKARTFLILFVEVEKIFSIRIPEEAIREMKFATYNTLLTEINTLTNRSCVS
ncbi:hypothetical protein J7E73_12790 [Paenibacillus albidus]|uniref:hypothetical protein n=1 Tax=Paenibacillus albidus TaxID=2041023 RepID=UPI001BECABBD|nr:hypothetical protein [Paenibacillus albidus]MBT2290006.1 hypothetical protein [Paenibacillus albidus]